MFLNRPRITFLIGALFAGCLMGTLPVNAQNAGVKLKPSTKQLSKGQTFSVEVYIADFNNLESASLPLLYNEKAVKHTDLTNENEEVCSFFDDSRSDPSEGFLLVDCAVLGNDPQSGTEELIYTVTFEAVGVGSSDITFDLENAFTNATVRLRDANNDPIPFSIDQEGVAAVVSPLPTASFTGVYDENSTETDFPSTNGTKARLRVNDPGGGSGGKITTALYEQTPPGGDDATFNDPDGQVTDPAVSERYWELTSSLSGAFDVDARFSYAGLGGTDNPAKLRVARRGLAAGPSESWTLVPVSQTTVDAGNEEVQIISSSSMEFSSGQYALVSNEDSNPLPVQLGSFSGRADGRTAVLTWKTLSEKNNRGFYVEQQTDGDGWKPVSSLIEGAGTTQEVQRYSHRVEDLSFGQHVFRLRQEDRDGNAEVFDDRRAEVNANMEGAYTLEAAHPNPFSSQTTIQFAVQEAQPVSVVLYNVLGQRVRVLHDGTVPGGKTVTLTLDGNQLSSGTYFLRLRSENFTASESVTLVR